MSVQLPYSLDMGKKRAKGSAKPVKEERFEMRLSPEDKAAFKVAADRQGIGVSMWLRLAGKMILRNNQGRVEL
jgi:predicted HicB family RNase H-like nuclease